MNQLPKTAGRSLLPPALFLLFGCLTILQVAVVLGGARLGSDGRADFRHFYATGYMVRTGHAAEIYDHAAEKQFLDKMVGPGDSFPFDHMAYESLLFSPFSFLGYRPAYFLFLAINLILLGVCTWMFKPYLTDLSAIAPWLPYALFASFLPVALALILGQDSIVLLTLMLAAFVSLQAGRQFLAGFLVALGLFKFQYVLPIALLFLLWRHWRFVSGVCVGGALVTGISLGTAGLTATRTFVRTLFAMTTGISTLADRRAYGTFPGRMPNLRGLFYTLSPHFSLTQTRLAMIVAACSLLLIAAAARQPASFPLALAVAVLVSYHGLIHDASLLIVPLGLILARAIPRQKACVTALVLTVFSGPAIVFRFLHDRYFLLTIPILALVWVAWSSVSATESRAPV